MDYRGTFEDGVIKPEGDVNLPNGTPVEFQPLAARPMTDEEREEAIARADQLARNPPTLEELTKNARVIKSLDDFDKVWPDDEDVDEFIRSIRERK